MFSSVLFLGIVYNLKEYLILSQFLFIVFA